jgi:hypothetical protein
VIVADVEPGSPADEAGIQVQDILLRLNGRAIGSVPFAEMMIATDPADSLLEAAVLRGTKKMAVHVRVKQQEANYDPLSDFDPSKALIRKLGILGVEVNDRFSGLRLRSGVMVAALAANVGSVRTDLQSIKSLLDSLPLGAPGVLQVEREGKLTYVTFEAD